MIGTQPQPAVAQQERQAFEAWVAKDCGDLRKFGSSANPHYSNSAVNNAWTGWQARAAAQAEPAAVQYLGAGDLADLERLEGLLDDGEGWDLPKERMTRLAELGAIQHHGFGRYGITAFGRLALDHPLSRRPLETVDECNARLSAEHKAKLAHLAAGGAQGSPQ
jgi:hypothetical protein